MGGALYVTDTALDFDGDDFHPGADRICRIGRDGSVRVALEAPMLEGPNGILWQEEEGRFIVASLLGDALFSWCLGSGPEVLARGSGGYDGIVELPAGRVLVGVGTARPCRRWARVASVTSSRG